MSDAMRPTLLKRVWWAAVENWAFAAVATAYSALGIAYTLAQAFQAVAWPYFVVGAAVILCATTISLVAVYKRGSSIEHQMGIVLGSIMQGFNATETSAISPKGYIYNLEILLISSASSPLYYMVEDFTWSAAGPAVRAIDIVKTQGVIPLSGAVGILSPAIHSVSQIRPVGSFAIAVQYGERFNSYTHRITVEGDYEATGGPPPETPGRIPLPPSSKIRSVKIERISR